MIRYKIPLREDMIAALILPRDLTEKEAKRLKAVIDVLVIPELDSSSITDCPEKYLGAADEETLA